MGAVGWAGRWVSSGVVRGGGGRCGAGLRGVEWGGMGRGVGDGWGGGRAGLRTLQSYVHYFERT